MCIHIVDRVCCNSRVDKRPVLAKKYYDNISCLHWTDVKPLEILTACWLDSDHGLFAGCTASWLNNDHATGVECPGHHMT